MEPGLDRVVRDQAGSGAPLPYRPGFIPTFLWWGLGHSHGSLSLICVINSVGNERARIEPDLGSGS